MGCEEIKKIIPGYFRHTASEEEIKKVEEHLCICHSCRIVLGKLMDDSAADEGSNLQEGMKPLSGEEEMEYFPAQDIEIPVEGASPGGVVESARNDIKIFPDKNKVLNFGNNSVKEKEGLLGQKDAESLTDAGIKQPSGEKIEHLSEEKTEYPQKGKDTLPSDRCLSQKRKVGLPDYTLLFAGIVILGFFIYLFMKG